MQERKDVLCFKKVCTVAADDLMAMMEDGVDITEKRSRGDRNQRWAERR